MLSVLSTVAAEARLHVAEQAAGTLPWIGAHNPADVERCRDEQHSRTHRIHSIQLGEPEQLIGADDPRYALQENGGLADFRYLDDGDIQCHPMLVLPNLQAFDAANTQIVTERNSQQTEVIHCISDLDAGPLDWQINDVRPLASVAKAVHGNSTLGVAVGPVGCVTDQLLAKADVIHDMTERVQLSQDPQTEFAFFRESEGVTRINHVLRVHGHTISS